VLVAGFDNSVQPDILIIGDIIRDTVTNGIRHFNRRLNSGFSKFFYRKIQNIIHKKSSVSKIIIHYYVKKQRFLAKFMKIHGFYHLFMCMILYYTYYIHLLEALMVNITPQKMGKFTLTKAGIIVGGILLLILLFTSVFIVDQAEEAVITRLGKYHVTKGPGLQLNFLSALTATIPLT